MAKEAHFLPLFTQQRSATVTPDHGDDTIELLTTGKKEKEYS